MKNNTLEQRFIAIEIALTNLQKNLDDLSDIVFKQGKIIDALSKQNQALQKIISQDVVKPLEQETPPPHY